MDEHAVFPLEPIGMGPCNLILSIQRAFDDLHLLELGSTEDFFLFDIIELAEMAGRRDAVDSCDGDAWRLRHPIVDEFAGQGMFDTSGGRIDLLSLSAYLRICKEISRGIFGELPKLSGGDESRVLWSQRVGEGLARSISAGPEAISQFLLRVSLIDRELAQMTRHSFLQTIDDQFDFWTVITAASVAYCTIDTNDQPGLMRMASHLEPSALNRCALAFLQDEGGHFHTRLDVSDLTGLRCRSQGFELYDLMIRGLLACNAAVTPCFLSFSPIKNPDAVRVLDEDGQIDVFDSLHRVLMRECLAIHRDAGAVEMCTYYSLLACYGCTRGRAARECADSPDRGSCMSTFYLRAFDTKGLWHEIGIDAGSPRGAGGPISTEIDRFVELDRCVLRCEFTYGEDEEWRDECAIPCLDAAFGRVRPNLITDEMLIHDDLLRLVPIRFK